jgi:hypothetical protein
MAKIIGAVTHVFVHDPTRGYGCFVDWMLMESASSPRKKGKRPGSYSRFLAVFVVPITIFIPFVKTGIKNLKKLIFFQSRDM